VYAGCCWVACCASRGGATKPESMAPPRSFVALRREILGGVEVPKLILSIVRSYEDYRPI